MQRRETGSWNYADTEKVAMNYTSRRSRENSIIINANR